MERESNNGSPAYSLYNRSIGWLMVVWWKLKRVNLLWICRSSHVERPSRMGWLIFTTANSSKLTNLTVVGSVLSSQTKHLSYELLTENDLHFDLYFSYFVLWPSIWLTTQTLTFVSMPNVSDFFYIFSFFFFRKLMQPIKNIWVLKIILIG